MEARTVIAEANPGQLDQLADFWDHERTTEIRSLDGNRGFLVLADPATNRVIAVSLWDTTEEADAAYELFETHASVIRSFMSHEPQREGFDVKVADLHEASIHPSPS
jgi:heme-degrading monooxygenase HmoA